MVNKLTDEDIKHVAKLSRLTLTDSEVKKFKAQLGAVVDYVSELEEVNTDNVEPTSQTTGLTAVYREDEPRATDLLSAADALSGTDSTHNNYFKVDFVFEGKRE